MPTIRQAIFPIDQDAVVSIFREYVKSPTVDLSFQEYEIEFAALPGAYAARDGRLLLACTMDAVLGCAALRRIDKSTCEMKRVYVRPEARGMKLGRLLVETILSEARIAGYSRICLDVLPEFTAARKLYKSLGFVTAEPVSFNPVPGTKFLSLALQRPTGGSSEIFMNLFGLFLFNCQIGRRSWHVALRIRRLLTR